MFPTSIWRSWMPSKTFVALPARAGPSTEMSRLAWREEACMPESICDQWAQWLLQRRHGGDPAQQKSDVAGLAQVRHHVLRNAQLAAGDVVLDVGTGDGLMAFGAGPGRGTG
jgi:hypothetical protein